MKCSTWNVHQGRGAGKKPNQSAIIQCIALMQPDFMALQEVPSQGWLDYVVNACAITEPLYGYFVETRRDGSGVGVITRHGCTMSVLSFGTSCLVPETKRVLIVRPLFTPNLVVMCTHFSSDASMVGQSSQAQQLANFVNETAGDVIVMGDLNAHSASPVLKKLYRTGLRDMWLTSATRERGYIQGCTFPNNGFAFQRIDYVLTRSSSMASDSAKTMSISGASDHKCVMVNISGTSINDD